MRRFLGCARRAGGPGGGGGGGGDGGVRGAGHRAPEACWEPEGDSRLIGRPRRLSHHLPGVAPGVAAPASRRAPQLKFPPLSRKEKVSSFGCRLPGAPPSRRGRRGRRWAGVPDLRPLAPGRPLTPPGRCRRPCGLSAGFRVCKACGGSGRTGRDRTALGCFGLGLEGLCPLLEPSSVLSLLSRLLQG